jgi:hypothetical protein
MFALVFLRRLSARSRGLRLASQLPDFRSTLSTGERLKSLGPAGHVRRRLLHVACGACAELAVLPLHVPAFTRKPRRLQEADVLLKQRRCHNPSASSTSSRASSRRTSSTSASRPTRERDFRLITPDCLLTPPLPGRGSISSSSSSRMRHQQSSSSATSKRDLVENSPVGIFGRHHLKRGRRETIGDPPSE